MLIADDYTNLLDTEREAFSRATRDVYWNIFVFGGLFLWNSCVIVKKPAAESVTVVGTSPGFSQYHPWMPGNGAVSVPDAVATAFRFS